MREPSSLESLTSVHIQRMQKYTKWASLDPLLGFFFPFHFLLLVVMFCSFIMPRSLTRSIIASWCFMFILWLLLVHLLMDKHLHCLCHSFLLCRSQELSRSWSMNSFPIKTEGVAHYQTVMNVKCFMLLSHYSGSRKSI